AFRDPVAQVRGDPVQLDAEHECQARQRVEVVAAEDGFALLRSEALQREAVSHTAYGSTAVVAEVHRLGHLYAVDARAQAGHHRHDPLDEPAGMDAGAE